MSDEFLGIDTHAARSLATVLCGWMPIIDTATSAVQIGEWLSDQPTGVALVLDDIGGTGQRLAAAIDSAAHRADNFRLDPGLAQLRLGAQPSGDAGGTFLMRRTRPYRAVGANPSDRGRSLLVRALRDTAPGSRIADDEFEAIFHRSGAITLVLPGVIDLWPLDAGFDDDHRSARDLDQHAVPSSRSTGIAENGYAAAVSTWVERQIDQGAIAAGAPVLIVGHSFGADTALDLASDAFFNGQLVTVTSVLAAGYYSDPQLDSVQPGTSIGVLRNVLDLVVSTEGIAHRDFPDGRLAVEATERMVNTGLRATNGLAAFGERLISSMAGDLGAQSDIDLGRVPERIELVGPSVKALGDGGFIAEFDRGFKGAGHHPANYVRFLQTPHLNERMQGYLGIVGNSGHGTDGIAVTVDISMPE